MRRSAKAVNFGIVYGISPSPSARTIGVTVAQAKEYMEKYFQHYAGVRAYMDAVVEQAKADGYVSTLFGPPPVGDRAEVLQLQHPVLRGAGGPQRPHPGTAADIIKLP